jgi:hypothetical protein
MPVANENSLFPIVQVDGPGDWDRLASLTRQFLTPRALVQLRDFLAPAVKSIIVETGYIDKDYRDTYAGFYAKKFAEYPNRTVRLHFFSARLDLPDLFQLKARADNYVGYAVVRPTRVNCIGRTVLDPTKIPGLSGHMCMADFTVHLLGTELPVRGFPYISQDTDVTVCAHAASWMVFRYFSEKYPNYAEAHPFEIAQMTADQSHGRLIPSKGLTIYQLSEMFSRFGFSPEIYLRDKEATDPGMFDRVLYYYIESGIPVVAGLLGKGHAISLFGHVSDYSLILPSESPGHSADYVRGWIANDDNHMPYQVVLRDDVASSHLKHLSPHKMSDIDAFVVPLYEKIYLSAEYIEKLAAAVLNHGQYGLARLSPGLGPSDLVVRIFLTSSKSYKCFRHDHPIPNQLDHLYLQLPMPKFVWICELSTKALYPAGKILGEILWDATANQNDPYAFLAIHYPRAIILNNRDSMAEDPSRFLLNDSLPVADAYDIYRHNLKECP